MLSVENATPQKMRLKVHLKSVNQIEDLENDITNENDETNLFDFDNQLMSMSPTGFEKLCRRLLMEVRI